ncbi:MFS general substrate transporter [Meredithblackwellia eburnea MCA 4105]
MTSTPAPVLGFEVNGAQGPVEADRHHEADSSGTKTPASQHSTDDEEKLEKPGASTYSYDTVFDDPVLAKYYAPPDNYESKHRFDPKATWTSEEEKKLIRKVDVRVCLFVCVCFAALQLDRGNISQALSDNMLVDLKISTNDYNLGQTIFYVCFLFMELPSQLISKKLGVDVWVPFQMIMWSVVSLSQFWLKGKKSFFATRALLGALEGGFIPDMILYLSYFYTAAELAWRLSFFWVSLTSTTIVGAFLAAGILQLRHESAHAGWRWLFLIEGIITLLVGIFAAFWLPPSPTQTKGSIRGKDGWFNEREETIIVTRVLRDDPTKSSMHNRQAIGFIDLWKSFTDFDHWPLYALGLTTFIAAGTVNAYFTLILKSLGFSTFHTNLLIIPSQVLFILFNLGLSALARRLDERTFVASIGSWWQLIFFIVLVAIPNQGAWTKYAVLTLLLAYPYAHPILVSWNSTISGSVRTRSVSASLYNIMVQLGSIISSNIYQAKDKPKYPHGNRVLLGIVSANIVLFFLTKAYFIFRNKQKRAAWAALTKEERAHYLATTTDEGNRRLDFVFKH